MTRIRLLLDGASEGSWNMAVDEALLESAAKTRIPSLRFYDWDQAWLSLGYFQRFGDRSQHAASLSCPVVRRASGGGAIVHDRQLTYSLAWPAPRADHGPWQQLVHDVHHALVDALGDWCIPAAICPPASPHDALPKSDPRPTRPNTAEAAFLCFQRHEPGDVLLANPTGTHKIAGSAQRRSRGAILQHGSVQWTHSVHAPEVLGIADLARQSRSPCELRDGWTERLTARWGGSFVVDRLSEAEITSARTHQQSRFGNPVWTARR